MTTEELKKEAEECMHNALFWLKLPISKENVEQGGSYILKLLEPREKRIAELEATCNKWFEHLKNREEELLNELNNQNAKYNKQIEELEKENAEFRKEWQEQVQKATDEGYARTLQTVQLTKAKELLKGWLGDFYSPKAFYQQRAELVEQSEQFLKENSTYERIQKAKYNYTD